MNKEIIKQIDNAMMLHINYKGVSSNGKYLAIMDRLASGYSGAKAVKVSKLCNDYFAAVGVSSLEQALERLRKIELTNKNKGL